LIRSQNSYIRTLHSSLSRLGRTSWIIKLQTARYDSKLLAETERGGRKNGVGATI